MDVAVKAVNGKGIVVGAGVVRVSRALAKDYESIPSEDVLERAKARLTELGILGAIALLDALRSHEDARSVVGYFGFTLDRERFLRTPLQEGESERDRAEKIMALPHVTFGSRTGKKTAVGDLVALTTNSLLDVLTIAERLRLSESLAEAAIFLAHGSSDGEA